MIMDFNRDWRFRKVGEEWKDIDLPHDAMILEKRNARCRNGVNSGYFPGGIYEYEKSFLVEDLKKSHVLHFEGIYQNSTIYINEKEVMKHRYGYTAFDCDISDDVIQGENKIFIHVDNSLEPNCRWYSGSGIYRPVTLYVRDRNYIKSVHIETLSYDPAIIKIETDGEIVEIYDEETLICSGKPGELMIPKAKLWSEETPYLYTCVVKNQTDEKRVKFGIRKLEWDPKTGFLVNGESVKLRGGCIHHDHGVLGACEYLEAEERRIRILKENGFNAIRFSHCPASQITLDVCDRLGMYVMNETFDGWYMPKTYHDYSRCFYEDWKDDITSMVESSFNHSCVIMYSIGNEVSETSTDKGVALCEEMRDFVHSLDLSRPVTAGVNVLLNVYANMGMGVYKEKGTYEPKPLPEDDGYKEKKTGSAFFNAMAQKLGKLMFVMSAGKKGDKACFGAANALDIIGLNYASSRYDADVKKYPDRMMVGSETMVRDLPYNWERVIKYPQLIGDFVWSAWDYLGEACIGDWTYHSYQGLPLLAGQGMIDITGQPLASMGFMQVVWGLRKKPYIAVRPLNHSNEKPSTGAWQFTNAIDSWSWRGYEGIKAIVEVYSPGEKARLVLNEKQIGIKRLKDYKAIFKVPYENGTLTAEALDENGNVISTHSLMTGEKETILSIRPEKKTVHPGGLFYVPIEFTDKNGDLKPDMEEKIELNVQGGRLMGFGSALCKSDELFDQSYHRSYRGRTLAVIKADDEKKVIIEAFSKGFEKAHAEIEVKE